MPRKADQAKHIEVRHSPVHGWGVFATRAIPQGRHIGRYAGRRYSAAESEQRDWDTAVTYVFGLSDGSVIDGGDGGNATRHLNHSCQPNCAAYEVRRQGGVLHIEIEARRRLLPGEELFIDYALQAADSPSADYRCQCGARRCRGTMLERTAG